MFAPLECVAGLVPLAPRATVNVSVATEDTVISSLPTRTTSLFAKLDPCPVATSTPVSEASRSSAIVVWNAPLFVPPQSPAPQPAPSTEELSPVPT